jgi:hypothetical protein
MKIQSIRFRQLLEVGPQYNQTFKNDIRFSIDVDWDKRVVRILQKGQNRLILVPMEYVEAVFYEPEEPGVKAGPGRGHKKVA